MFRAQPAQCAAVRTAPSVSHSCATASLAASSRARRVSSSCDVRSYAIAASRSRALSVASCARESSATRGGVVACALQLGRFLGNTFQGKLVMAWRLSQVKSRDRGPPQAEKNSPGLTRMSPGCGTRRLGISASRRRRRSGGSNLGGGFLLHLRWRCWNCASVTHGSISVRCSHIATACCVALVVVVVVARLPRCRNNAFISVACAAATTHTCGSPSSSLSLSSSLLFNVMHRPWRLHPRRRNRAQTRLLKKHSNRSAAQRAAAPPLSPRRRIKARGGKINK